MEEGVDPFVFLARWAAVRLLAWWERRPADQKWHGGAWAGVGFVKGALLGFRPKNVKLINQCIAERARLLELMLGPDLEACA